MARDTEVDIIIESHRRDGRATSDPTALLRAFSVEPEVDGLTLSDIFVRELFQNILDLASAPGSGTFDLAAEVEEVTLTADAVSAIKESIGGEKNLKKLTNYRHLLSRSGEDSGFQLLQDGKEVRCTIVSDHTGACASKKKGMHGTTDPNFFQLDDKGSKTTFERYVLAAGYPDKMHAASVGGHGIGKIANTIASKDSFVIIYTYTNEEVDGTQGLHKCVCVGFDEHLDDASKASKEAYERYGPTTGAMYIGHHHSQSGSDGVRETRDETAKNLAAAFGIKPREEGDYGTSICVFNSKVALKDVRESYHKWFFPAHFGVKEAPSVRFCARKWNSSTSNTWQSVNFDDYPPLKPYIRAYDLAREFVKPDTEIGEEFFKLRARDFASSASPGSIGFSIYDDLDEEDEFRNQVAQIRQFLVVNYFTPVTIRRATVKNFAGAYLPSDSTDILEALAAAEPPKHHTWSLEQPRLSKLQRDIVSGITSRIKSTYSRFVNGLLPDERFKDKKNKELARALGRLLSNSKGKGDTVERLPTEIQLKQEITEVKTIDSFNFFKVHITAQVSKNFDESKHTFPLEIKVTPNFYPVGAISREPLPIRFEGEKSYFSRTSRLFELKDINDEVSLEVETKTAAPEVELTVAAEIR